MQHLGLKIAALLCALALWFFVVANKVYTIQLEVPLKLHNLPNNLAVASHVPHSLPVTMEGKGFDLIRFRHDEENQPLRLDLLRGVIGTQALDLRNASIQSPHQNNIKIISIEAPPVLTVELDARVYRDLPVRLNQIIPIKKGSVMIGQPSLSPSTIRVWGARKVLTKLFELTTQPINLPPQSQSDTLEIPIQQNSLPYLAQAEQLTVKLSFDIQRKTTRSFEGIPTQLIGSFDHQHYTLSPAKVDLTLEGGEQILQKLTPEQIRIFVEFNRFALENTDSLKPTIRVDAPILNLTSHPDYVHLRSSLPDSLPATGNF